MSKITKELTFPNSVTIFGGRAGAVPVERSRGDVPVTIHGVSFAQPHAPDSLLPRLKAPIEGAVNIGLLHTSVGGSEGHDLYDPCELADLRRAGFRYWALGHVHRRSTSEGEVAVVMPGIPQGRDIGEAGAKSVTDAIRLLTAPSGGRRELYCETTDIPFGSAERKYELAVTCTALNPGQ